MPRHAGAKETKKSWDDILTSIHWKKEGISIKYQASQENEEIREYYQHRHEQKKHEEK